MSGAVQAALASPIALRKPVLSAVVINANQSIPTLGWASIGFSSFGELLIFRGTGAYPTASAGGRNFLDWSGLAALAVSVYGNRFEARLDVVSGNAPDAGSSAVGVWFDLSAGLVWIMQGIASPGIRSATWQLSVRQIGNPVVVVTANFDLTANSV